MTQLKFKMDMEKYIKLYNSTCIGGVSLVAQMKFANWVLKTLEGDLMLTKEQIKTVAEAMAQYSAIDFEVTEED